jgi:hypothetical protein
LEETGPVAGEKANASKPDSAEKQRKRRKGVRRRSKNAMEKEEKMDRAYLSRGEETPGGAVLRTPARQC